MAERRLSVLSSSAEMSFRTHSKWALQTEKRDIEQLARRADSLIYRETQGRRSGRKGSTTTSRMSRKRGKGKEGRKATEVAFTAEINFRPPRQKGAYGEGEDSAAAAWAVEQKSFVRGIRDGFEKVVGLLVAEVNCSS
jgi:hypothetical protein